MRLWGKAALLVVASLTLAGCSAPSADEAEPSAVEPSASVTPSAEPTQAQPAFDLSAPQTTQEWCERVFAESDVVGFLQREGIELIGDGRPAGTGYVSTGNIMLSCVGESFIVMVGEAIDQQAADERLAAFESSSLAQIQIGNTTARSIGGVDGELTYPTPDATGGGAVFSGYSGLRALMVGYLSFGQAPPAEAAFVEQYDSMVQLATDLPFPVNPTAAACPIAAQGELVSGNLLQVIPFAESRLHAPDMEIGVTCSYVQSIDGVETGRHTIISGWNEESIGGSLEAAGWRFCTSDEKEYYLADDNDRTLKFPVGYSEESTITVFDGAMC
jgi:hypothetical protein